jgi:hypothetical protein
MNIKRLRDFYVKPFIEHNCIYHADPTVQYSESFPIGRFVPRSPNKVVGDSRIFMLRNLLYNVIHRQMLMRMMDHMFPDEPVQYAGLESGSIPFLMAIQEHLMVHKNKPVNVFSVLSERKGYGINQYVNGRPNDLPVVIVDDMINSGQSIRRAMSVVGHELELPIHETILAIIHSNPPPPGFVIRSSFMIADFDDAEKIVHQPKDTL